MAFLKVRRQNEAAADSGCVEVDTAAAGVTLDLGTLACNGHRCPPCFEITSGNHPLILLNCSRMYVTESHQLGSGAFASAVQSIAFLNLDMSSSVGVYDGSNLYSIGAGGYAVGACRADGNTLFMNGRVAMTPTTTTTTTVLYTLGTCYHIESYYDSPKVLALYGSPYVGFATASGSGFRLAASGGGASVTIEHCDQNKYVIEAFSDVRQSDYALTQWEVVTGLAGTGTLSFISSNSNNYMSTSGNNGVVPVNVNMTVESERQRASWTLVEPATR